MTPNVNPRLRDGMEQAASERLALGAGQAGDAVNPRRARGRTQGEALAQNVEDLRAAMAGTGRY